MTRIGKTLCLVVSATLWQGCSSTSDSTDGSVDGSVDVASDTSTVFLSRGMNYYKITAISGINDGCEIDAASFLNAVVPASFVEATQVLGVGTLQGVPLQPSLGSGVVGTSGTLTRENDATDLSGCSWHQKDVSLFQLTGGDIFTLDVTETESAFIAACGSSAPTGGTCMTTYKITLGKTTAPVDGGTN